MSNLTKALLTITNIIGAITIVMALIIPFITPIDNTGQLVLGIWMMIAGFTLWYFSNKSLNQSNP
jgi:hypothetical protein